MPILALVAAMLLNFFGGLLYCWSVFIEPFEKTLDVSRSDVSSVFSIALVTYMLGFFIFPRVLRLASMPVLSLAVCLLAALGLALAGLVHSLPALIVGYGVIFGLAVGLAYSLCLQAANIELPVRRSLATSLAVSSFAGAGLLWPKLLTLAIDWQGPHTAMLVCAGVFVVVGIAAALLLTAAGAQAPGARDALDSGLFTDFLTDKPRVFLFLWLGFVLMGLGGLMVISHSAGIVGAFGVPREAVYLGPMVVSIGYIAGGMTGGIACDLITGRRVLIGLAAVIAVSLLTLYLFADANVSLAVLALAGGAFGASAAAYPVTIVGYYGVSQLARIYGRVMIAYGVAGLAAPWMAGALYNWEGGYRWALLIAGVMAAASVIANFTLPKPRKPLPALD